MLICPQCSQQEYTGTPSVNKGPLYLRGLYGRTRGNRTLENWFAISQPEPPTINSPHDATFSIARCTVLSPYRWRLFYYKLLTSGGPTRIRTENTSLQKKRVAVNTIGPSPPEGGGWYLSPLPQTPFLATYVEVTGFEPATFCVQGRHSTN